jgi:hypothetical protein
VHTLGDAGGHQCMGTDLVDRRSRRQKSADPARTRAVQQQTKGSSPYSSTASLSHK